jgi:hypothetical protein
MAEPPPAWIVPGDEPDDPDPRHDPARPIGPGPSLGPNSPAPTGAPPPDAPGGWGAPPSYGQPAGWGPPPGQPSAAPAPSRPNQPNQWSPPPNQWAQPPGNQWGGPPPNGNWSNRGAGIVPLRPLAIGEIFDGAIRAIRANPRTMVGFSAIVIAVLTLLATVPQAYALASLLNSPLLDPNQAESADFSDVADLASAGGISVLVNALQFVLATTIISGLLIVAVDGAVRGQKMTPAQLWQRCRRRLLAVLGLACLVVLALPAVMLALMLPGLVLLFVPGPVVPVIGAILLVLGAAAGFVAFLVLYFGFWAMAAPALLLEDLGVFAALSRSYRLVRGSFWRVVGIGLLTTLIAYIIRQLFTIPFSLIGTVVAGARGSDSFGSTLIQLLIGDIGAVLAGAVVFPFTAGVTALLYLDLRMRREGLDVDLMRS